MVDGRSYGYHRFTVESNAGIAVPPPKSVARAWKWEELAFAGAERSASPSPYKEANISLWGAACYARMSCGMNDHAYENGTDNAPGDLLFL